MIKISKPDQNHEMKTHKEPAVEASSLLHRTLHLEARSQVWDITKSTGSHQGAILGHENDPRKNMKSQNTLLTPVHTIVFNDFLQEEAEYDCISDSICNIVQFFEVSNQQQLEESKAFDQVVLIKRGNTY